MKSEEVIEILSRYSSIPNDGESFSHITKAYDEAIKAVEVVEKIKKAFIESDTQYDKADILDCNNCTHFTGKTYNVLCTAYGTEGDRESWLRETDNE